MARICPRQNERGGPQGPLQSHMGGAGAALRSPPGDSYHTGRLPCIPQGAQGAGDGRQHRPNGTGAVAGVSQADAGKPSSTAVDAARVETTQHLPDARRFGEGTWRRSQPARRAIHRACHSDRGENVGDPRPDLEAGGFHERVCGLDARRSKRHEQAAGEGWSSRAGVGLGTVVPSGTVPTLAETAGKCGGRYRARTCGVLGVNERAHRQFKHLAQTPERVLPICARFGPFVFSSSSHSVPTGLAA